MYPMIILADATPSTGSGHVMRCLALAQAAQVQGFAVRFLSKIYIDWVKRRLKQENISFSCRPGPVCQQEDPGQLLSSVQAIQKTSWVVLDGYHFGTDCQKALVDEGYRLLVIDDCNHLPEYCCDILLNQNIGAEHFSYQGQIGRKLFGPKFALIRKEFITARENKPPIPDSVRHILFTLGGGDFSAMLPELASQYAIPEMAPCILRIVAGGMPPHRIEKAFEDCPAQVEILSEVNNMSELMCWADVCVTAGGSTCWELCCMNVPFLTVEVAENQRKIINYLEQKHLAQRFSRKNLADLLADAPADSKEPLLVDGLGAERVLTQMLSFLPGAA